jgi:hypothetical protein
MLDVLDDFLSVVLPPPPGPPPPPPPSSLPARSLSLVSVTERTVGLGNRRGTDTVGPFAVLALKGVRLEAIVRYQFWGTGPAETDALVSALQGQLGAASTQLRTRGFLHIAAENSSLAEHVASLGFWRRTADYRVLFEFHYQDADGAESLIARIPIDIDSTFKDSTSVTDEMTRWDDVEAPELFVRRKRARTLTVNELTLLAHLPDGWNGKPVTMTVIIEGATTAHIFTSAREFTDAFTPEPEAGPVMLGGKDYREGSMKFPNPIFPFSITLSGDEDVFSITYNAPKFANDSDVNIPSEAVVYLRVLS